jgi:hypothetical protein
MRKTMTWVAAAAASIAMAGCGAGGEAVGTSSSAATVEPLALDPFAVYQCSSPELGLPPGLKQDTIGTTTTLTVPAYEIDFPYALDLSGNTITLAFNETNNVFDWSVDDEAVVRVRAIIVSGNTTGSNVYVYPSGATSDVELRSPAPGGTTTDDSIVRVKLCFEYVEDDGGCTLTQGYWKNHSSNGPAPLDATWNGLENEPFFESGKTYHQVLLTPARGNAYYILAYQFIAAKLNGMAGASMSADLQAAFDEAAALFEGAADDTLAESVRARAIELGGLLGAYNEGETGPGHCE